MDVWQRFDRFFIFSIVGTGCVAADTSGRLSSGLDRGSLNNNITCLALLNTPIFSGSCKLTVHN